MTTVKALKPFTYRGKTYKEGDEVEMTKAAAAQHGRLDYVSLPNPAPEKTTEAGKQEVPKTKSDKK